MIRAARPLAIMLLAALSAFLSSSCIRMGESSIKLPANPILTAGLGWGVVKEAYVRLKDSPSETARDVDHLRRGSVFALNARVLGSGDKSAGAQTDPAPTVWYGVSSEGLNGWVQGSELDIYSSQEQANKASSGYR